VREVGIVKQEPAATVKRQAEAERPQRDDVLAAA
jgi:hypothetical protein